MEATEYLDQCPYKKDCGDVLCSPWGFTHTESPEVNGKILLLVGLNDNGNDGNIKKSPSRTKFSDYFKKLIRDEVEDKLKHISNIIPPVTRFLLGSNSKESRLFVLEHLNWCNVISCCPNEWKLGSEPTRKMRDNCKKRLREDQNHELINRIALICPTHILVLGGDTKNIWDAVYCSGSKLYDTCHSRGTEPTIVSSYHPSSRIGKDDYFKKVYKDLSGEEW